MILVTGMCKNCELWPSDHVDGKCPFSSTRYEKYTASQLAVDPFEFTELRRPPPPAKRSRWDRLKARVR